MKTIRFSIAITMLLLASNLFAADLSELSKLLNGKGAVSEIANNIIGTSTPSINQMVGTWKSTGPAIYFKSADIVKSGSGAIIASTAKNQLYPYYKRAGLENMTITFTADSKFSIKFDKGTLTGTVVKNSDNSFTMKFNAFNKIKIGEIKANISRNTNLDITFEVNKLVDLVSKIATKVDKQSISTIVDMLKSYDGIYAGFSFAKQ